VRAAGRARANRTGNSSAERHSAAPGTHDGATALTPADCPADAHDDKTATVAVRPSGAHARPEVGAVLGQGLLNPADRDIARAHVFCHGEGGGVHMGFIGVRA